MNRAQQLAERRIALIERAALQRLELGTAFHGFEKPASMFDKGFSLARSIRSHPVMAMGVGLAVVAFLRKRTFSGKLVSAAVMALRFGLSVAASRK